MKIGILSMQRIINNGSLLQAYGLKKTIENLGFEVEFVDYKIEKSQKTAKNHLMQHEIQHEKAGKTAAFPEV